MSVFITIYMMIGFVLGLMALHERGKEKKNDLFDKIGLPVFTSITWFGFIIIFIVCILQKDEKKA